MWSSQSRKHHKCQKSGQEKCIILSYSKVMKAPCWILTKKNYCKNNEMIKTIELKNINNEDNLYSCRKMKFFFFLPPGGVLKQKVLLLLPEWFKAFSVGCQSLVELQNFLALVIDRPLSLDMDGIYFNLFLTQS